MSDDIRVPRMTLERLVELAQRADQSVRKDHACRECDGDMGDGSFVCALHATRKLLAAPPAAQPSSAQDFSDLAALEGPLGTAELYLRMIEPDDPDTSVPDGLAAARKRLASHVSHPPQPVTPVEGKE